MIEKPGIIFSDADLVVVNKPPGITVIPERVHTERETLQSILQDQFGKLFVVHRIDRATSGIVCFAKNESAHRNLSMQFQNHHVKKIYKAIVTGKLKDRSGSIDLPILENKSKAGTMMINRRGKNALTIYSVEEQYRHAALLSIEIKTGRTHQIRIHMASLGHALLMDEMYGEGNKLYLSNLKKKYKPSAGEERPVISRLALHASELTFRHPETGAEIALVAPLAADMQTLLKILRRYDLVS